MINDNTNTINNISKRNYFSMINKANDGFADNGWSDGYADMPSDHEEILNQLYGWVPNNYIIHYLDMYLQGYEIGKWMSENSEEIYDEDGCFKDEKYSLDSMSQTSFARQLVLARKQNIE